MELLPDAELMKALQLLTGWKYDTRGKALQQEFTFADFKAAMRFVDEVAALAEKLNHHPDIDIRYNIVRISTWSHDSGGVTKRDVKLAEGIQKLRNGGRPSAA